MNATSNARVTHIGSVPMIRGTQISVAHILTYASEGMSPEQIVVKLPGLTQPDVSAAMEYAADLVRQQEQQQPPAAAASSYACSTAEPELDMNRILVVDDVAPNRLLMERVFQRSGIDVSVAASGAEALELARAERPYLVLSDIDMPVMDGFELCRRLKQDPLLKDVAVIFITAHYRSSQHISEGLDLGADDYIQKPFDREELLARVRAVARLKHAEAEARHQAREAARRNLELELLNELSRAISSSLADTEVAQIPPESLQKLAQLLDAEAVALFLLNEAQTRLSVTLAQMDAAAFTTALPFTPDAELTPLSFQELLPALIRDLAQTHPRALSTETPTVRSVPMASHERAVGALAVLNRAGGPLTAANWMLLNSAAGVITVAVENAQLWWSVQRQVQDLRLLNEVGNALTSTLDLQQVLEQTTYLAQVALNAETASVWLVDETGAHLQLAALSGTGARVTNGHQLPLTSDIVLGDVVLACSPRFSADIQPEEQPLLFGEAITSYAPRSILCVPLQVQERAIGVIQAMHSQAERFSHSDVQLFESVASAVSIAVENARLFSEVQAFNHVLEQRVAERTRELREEQETTVAILASMADGLIVLDAQGHILMANRVAEEMLDFTLSQARGTAPPPTQLESALWRCVHHLAASHDATATAAVDVADATRAGGVLSIEARAAKVHDDSDAALGTVIVLRDITALKEVERMKARFMAGVTHELKTPLAVIRTHVTNLLTYHRRINRRKREALFNSIHKQVEILQQLVENILTLSRFDAGGVALDMRPVDLAPLTEQIVSELEPLAAQKNLALHWTRPPSSATTQGDPVQLARVIRNLVDNAIKYTPAGGAVHVTVEAHGAEGLRLRVRDTGIGIPPAAMGRLFERFYRVDPSHTTPGTGLGLSIVKEIIEAHGGTIEVESTPDVGSTFQVQLPSA
jgi:two-component system phosphate regulon sensor histidine kinase PhoR